MPKIIANPFALLLVLLAQTVAFAQVAPEEQLPPEEDKTSIYRLHPDLDNVKPIVVPKEELTPGLVYSYYHPGLEQRVWGIAQEDGTFEFAFGEGTTIPTNMFDLRLSPEMRERVLEQRSPRLLSELSSVGRSAAVRLNGKGIWELLPFPSSARVFDLLSSRRWEWHGHNRHAVVHTGGYLWHVVDGEYYPVNIVGEICHK
jgi:hypothetical protein